MNIERNNFIMKGLQGLYCIHHRKNPNVYINDEGFITVSTCCEEFHGALYHAQEALREQYDQLSVEAREEMLRP